MRVLMVTSEMSPLARTGGLADVLEALPKVLQNRGHEVSVILPFYRVIRENPAIKPQPTGVRVAINVGAKRVEAEILQATSPDNIQLFLVKRDEYFDRSEIYGSADRAYDDNAERYIFFSKAVVELARRLSPQPEIIHCHDWQTALIPVFIKDQKLPFKTILTIHNLAYQGSFWGVDFGLTNLPTHYFGARGVEFYGALNCLKGGILFADGVTTVSAVYAREIQTPEHGCGLDAVIRENSYKIRGILDGADYDEWNPETDKLIPRKFKFGSLAGKKACRNALLEQYKLDAKPAGPVFSMIGRLAEQKGLDILIPVLDRLLADDVRLVILGAGESAYETALSTYAKRYAGKFAYIREFSQKAAHLIEAGSDINLIPSHFEPCGLSALYSLKYGTIPIARAVGGLQQIVREFDPVSKEGHGFLFYDYSADALWDVILNAKRMFATPANWSVLVDRAMACDFSWPNAAAEYEKYYQEIASRH